MKKMMYGMAAAAALFVGTSANAATVITFNDGNGGLSAGESLYASFSPGSTGNPTGSNFIIKTGTDGQGADPAVGGQGDPYLSVLAGGVANFVFSTPLSQLGLDYGSADTYNTFTLLFLNGTSETYTGQQLIDIGIANGDQAAARTNGRLTFSNFTSPLTGLRLNSGQNSLEVDNFGVVNAVPEPGTWAMMLLGFGAVGFAMRRRRTGQVLPQAA
mgnify:CR=1 FL=1